MRYDLVEAVNVIAGDWKGLEIEASCEVFEWLAKKQLPGR